MNISSAGNDIIYYMYQRILAPAATVMMADVLKMGGLFLGIVAIVFFAIGAFALRRRIYIALGVDHTASASAVGVTLGNYKLLQSGMRYPEVEQILGSPGDKVSINEFAGYAIVIYVWHGCAAGSFVNLMFQNGMMVHKIQCGLR